MPSCKFRAIATAVTVVGFAALVTLARAQDVPTLDIEQSCRDAANPNLDLQAEPTVQNCINEEQTARHTLEGEWSTFPASDRRDCTMEEETGPPSYVDLLWCLRDAKATPKP